MGWQRARMTQPRGMRCLRAAVCVVMIRVRIAVIMFCSSIICLSELKETYNSFSPSTFSKSWFFFQIANIVLSSIWVITRICYRGCPLGVSRITSYLYVCGAHALPGAVRVLHPGLIVSAAPELPPPPEDYVPRQFVPLLDTPNSDMHPYMESVADLINEVSLNQYLNFQYKLIN